MCAIHQSIQLLPLITDGNMEGGCAIHQSIQLLPLITDRNMEGGVCYTSIYTTITIDNRQEHGRGCVLYINPTIDNRREHGRGCVLYINPYNYYH